MREAPNQQRSLTTGSSGRRYRTAAEPERYASDIHTHLKNQR
jgi:hypothetical protein